MNDYIYIYIFGFASVARNLNSEIHHMTQNTPKDGGGGVFKWSYFHFPLVFFEETLRFTNLVSRHFRHYVAEVKANQWGGATGQASMLQQIQWMKWLMITSRACGRNSNRKWIYNLKPHNFFSYNVCSKMPSLFKKTPVRVHDFTSNRPPSKDWTSISPSNTAVVKRSRKIQVQATATPPFNDISPPQRLETNKRSGGWLE